MSVDLTILTSDRGYKKIRTSNELELYYSATRVDLLRADSLIADPLQWWIQVRQDTVPYTIKDDTRLSLNPLH